jgi:hypothetical protein
MSAENLNCEASRDSRRYAMALQTRPLLGNGILYAFPRQRRRHSTMKQLREAVFSVGSSPRLYNEIFDENIRSRDPHGARIQDLLTVYNSCYGNQATVECDAGNNMADARAVNIT